MTRFKVLEVDQWTSTGDVGKYTLDTFELSEVAGGESAAARAIFGGSARILEVDETRHPQIGSVWFRPGPDGRLVRYAANYDSSD
jgi:hypothetical protein